MLHTIRKQSRTWLVLSLILATTVSIVSGCTGKTDSGEKNPESKGEQKEEQTISYTSVTIPIDDQNNETLVYHPADNVLSQIIQKDRTYTLLTWQEETGWSTSVENWKLKKHYTLDHFTYNTNGTLYACRKKRKKGKLVQQTLVRLRSNGRIQKVRLTDLNKLSSPSSSHELPEITDIQCCGTSIAITYQYGTVKIYNLAEGQALGASTITGTPGKNTFYNLHYLSLMTQKSSQTILLRDYDIRSGEITRSFPLGGAGQTVSDYHITSYQDDLYVLTGRGLFIGQCSESTLTEVLSYSDLKLPERSRVIYFQAGRDASLYLGYETEEKDLELRLIYTPDPVTERSDKEQSSKGQAPAQISWDGNISKTSIGKNRIATAFAAHPVSGHRPGEILP